MRFKFSVLIVVVFLVGCNPNFDDPFLEGESVYKPILMNLDQMRNNSVSFTTEVLPMKNPGKILTYNGYIFVTDVYRGVHIINNTNPKSPINEGYISIPGVTDVHIKNGIFYANNAIDLLAIDFESKSIVKRIENVFPEATSTPDGLPFSSEYAVENRPANSVIIEWVKIK